MQAAHKEPGAVGVCREQMFHVEHPVFTADLSRESPPFWDIFSACPFPSVYI